MRALRAEGWVPESELPHEWHVYRHPNKATEIVVNPDWEEIWEGDAVFVLLHQDMGISAERLLELFERR